MSVYLHVWVRTLQQFLDSLEVTLYIEVKIVGGTGLQ